MFKNGSIKIISILAVVAILGIGSNVWAEMGRGYGHHGYGRHQGYEHHGCDYGSDLTQEEMEKLQAEQAAFDKGTRKLRQNMYQKKLALESELAKENPDAQKALKIQKQISDLKAQIDQKRVDYMIKARAIAPNAGRGLMRGYGHHGVRGRGMGPGSGDRPCWR